jgi:hypothetical protein
MPEEFNHKVQERGKILIFSEMVRTASENERANRIE